ncbi:hypothetical protein B0T26DRAFT_815237 [Lasiosphaeria miniovina]|uniref:Uncharacterized protein n=1 Tax=Lasiosphaeria miniovina TaxID=1954250 RepID=A0AA40A0L2_9PEZI|nr:uncharacterized protein B0T26DRAFT_815237 [Lasiosphaeria miniovina]KAK0707116.1 hypothetical protein B0T26DRAFT_815237 [Lasiosphaeria miniovina]
MLWAVLLALAIAALTVPASTIPISVNYFSRMNACNKEYGFYFHTAKTSYVLSQDKASILLEAGMKKLNIAGGEPFLYLNLHLESVSIVTKGSKVTGRFLKEYGKYIDVLAVSCDSMDEQTNIKIGRGDGNNVAQLFRIRGWCRKFGFKFKLDTVVCRLNFNEDMFDMVLMVHGENDAEETLRDARRWEITDDEFAVFCKRHSAIFAFISESNRVMASSYLVVGECMRFMDKGSGKMRESESILDGVEKALS